MKRTSPTSRTLVATVYPGDVPLFIRQLQKKGDEGSEDFRYQSTKELFTTRFFSLSVCLSLALSLLLTHAYTKKHTHTQKHTHYLSFVPPSGSGPSGREGVGVS